MSIEVKIANSYATLPAQSPLFRLPGSFRQKKHCIVVVKLAYPLSYMDVEVVYNHSKLQLCEPQCNNE